LECAESEEEEREGPALARSARRSLTEIAIML
jgi:hypothetical protein